MKVSDLLHIEALEYPNYKSFDSNNEKEIQTLVIWMEEMKIRHYEPNERQDLRDINNSNWTTVYKKYLKDLECPDSVVKKNINESLSWLISYAVAIEYNDNIDKYKNIDVSPLNNTNNDNNENKLNINDNEGKDGLNELAPEIRKLASLLQIKFDENVPLRSLLKTCVNILKDSQIKGEEELDHSGIKKQLGFSTGNDKVDKAGGVLRLLHIRDLRELQTHINQTIAYVQEHTMDPKTDSKLGRVGR